VELLSLLTQDRQVSKMRIEAEVGVVSGECAEFRHERSREDGIARQLSYRS
jgi:hypothetical protein